MRKIKTFLLAGTLAIAGLSFTSCATNTGTGALLGGAGGAALGAAIDKNDRGRGALIGGAAGAVGGALIGKEQDERARDAYYRSQYPPPYPPRY